MSGRRRTHTREEMVMHKRRRHNVRAWLHKGVPSVDDCRSRDAVQRNFGTASWYLDDWITRLGHSRSVAQELEHYIKGIGPTP
jgi:hypothetical protein